MSSVEKFALFVLFLEVVTAIILFVFVASWPGRIAAQRKHPQAQAIKIGGWAATILLGVLWPVVLIWAFTIPTSDQARRLGEAEAKNDDLESELAALKKQLKKSKGVKQ